MAGVDQAGNNFDAKSYDKNMQSVPWLAFYATHEGSIPLEARMSIWGQVHTLGDFDRMVSGVPAT